MTFEVKPIGGRLGLSGTLEFRDATGAVIKTVDLIGSIPLSETGLTVEQAKQLVQGEADGADH